MFYAIQVKPSHTPLMNAFHAFLYAHLQINGPAREKRCVIRDVSVAMKFGYTLCLPFLPCFTSKLLGACLLALKQVRDSTVSHQQSELN